MSVSLSGDGNTVAMGSQFVEPLNAEDGEQYGSARVFRRQGNDWEQAGETIYGKQAWDHLGAAVALSGDGKTLAIGVPGSASVSGHVAVYEWSQESWLQIGSDITDSLQETGSTISLSFDGTIVAVGSPNVHNDGPGSATVFRQSNDAATGTQEWWRMGQRLEDGFHSFGTTVSLLADGTKLAFASLRLDQPDTPGQIYFYAFSENDNQWMGESVLRGWPYRSHSVALSNDGNIIAFGSPSWYENRGGAYALAYRFINE